MNDGSIRYLDLQVPSNQTLQPKVLIPPSGALESMDMDWFIFDTDFTSMSSTANQACHLAEFRIATCLSYSPDRGGYHQPTSRVDGVDIWHVSINGSTPNDGTNALHAHHLSKVSAPHLVHCDLRLLGRHVAYHSNFADHPWTDGSKGALEIADWSKPNSAADLNGEDETDGRWFIPLDVDANVLVSMP
jgi:hypothetical protein